MKNIILVLCALVFTCQNLVAQDVIELDSTQSMLISGKGPGQDGAINPYLDSDCYAIVKNLGESSFSIRVQKKGEIIETIPVKGMESKKVLLLVNYELYFDTNENAVVEVEFEKKV